MREDNGIIEIEVVEKISIEVGNKICFQRAIDKLSRHHIRHIKAYDPHEGKVTRTIQPFIESVRLFFFLNSY